jgi:hypothetical protein
MPMLFTHEPGLDTPIAARNEVRSPEPACVSSHELSTGEAGRLRGNGFTGWGLRLG